MQILSFDTFDFSIHLHELHERPITFLTNSIFRSQNTDKMSKQSFHERGE